MASGGVSFLNHSLTGLTLMLLMDPIMDIATSEFRETISSFWGFPLNARILYNWLRVEFPGNIGFPINISPNIQPMLHMSADLSYVWEPSRTYGALYHRVATYSVRIMSDPYLSVIRLRARPKSQILRWQSLLSRTLDGFRSRCISWALCRNLIPLTIW